MTFCARLPASREAVTRPRQLGRVSPLVPLGILVVFCTGVVALEFVRRHALYWYEVDQDYHYAFPVEREHVAQIGEVGFRLPPANGAWQSGVVALEVAALPTGYWFEPCVEVGPRSEPQCFERGARGRRFLVLNPGLVDRDGFIALRGRHLRWNAATEPLWLFDLPSHVDGKLLVLAPHPDDAEIAAFGLYSTMTSYVVTMTAGNYVDGLYRRLATSHSDQDALRGDVRTWDSLTVPAWGGVSWERTVNLGYPTYSLARYHAAEGDREPQPGSDETIGRYRQGAIAQLLRSRVASSDWESVVQDLAAAIETIQPFMIAAPHPMLDGHTDHQYTTIALLEALARVHDPPATLLLYTNHHPQSESYPYGPSDALIAVPPWFDRPFPVPGVLSFPLAPDTQLRKLFALEAMHDLRAPPLRLNGGPATVLANRVQQAWELIRSDPFGDYSHFRRSVRPNELFFTYSPSDRAALRAYLGEHFLKSLPGIADGDPTGP